LSAQEYVEDFLWKKIRPRKIVIGYDHRFGNDRQGDIALMRRLADKLRFEVVEIEAQTVDNISVSSTKIRNALLSGDLAAANSLLGRFYSITGKVVRGDQRGTKIGYPTANIHVRDPVKLIPASGVYAVKVVVDGEIYGGMLNIGLRPTFNGQHETIEAHIFDFAQNIYGTQITVEFAGSIRKEVKFKSADELTMQLAKDKEVSLRILREQKNA